MKISLLCVLIFLSTTLKSQQISFSASIGSGKTYMIEDWYNSVNVSYGIPLSAMTEFKYSPINSNWGIKLRLNSLQSTCNGENWVDLTPLNGFVESLTTALLLERETHKDNFSYGLSLGIGWTTETIQQNQIEPTNRHYSGFPTIIFGEHLTWKINDNFDFQILPSLYWQDPYKTICYIFGIQSATFAGEDLSFAVNIGLRYNIMTKK